MARLRAPSSVQTDEGMVLVALTFLFTPLAMCYPSCGKPIRGMKDLS
jgi:hypothetical protein